jgi:hypothetical protein
VIYETPREQHERWSLALVLVGSRGSAWDRYTLLIYYSESVTRTRLPVFFALYPLLISRIFSAYSSAVMATEQKIRLPWLGLTT